MNNGKLIVTIAMLIGMIQILCPDAFAQDEFKIEPGVFSDPDPSTITPENAEEVARMHFPFIQVQPRWNPPPDSDEMAYRDEWLIEARRLAEQRCAVVERLIQLVPEHPKMNNIFGGYLDVITNTLSDPDRTIDLADQYLKENPNGQCVEGVWRGRTFAFVKKYVLTPDEPDVYTALSALELAHRNQPQNHLAYYLMLMANTAEYVGDSELRRHLLHRVIEYYPDSEFAAVANGKLDEQHWIGQPFDLSFNDVITGEAVSIVDYRGKVVLVDFWATWCGPCRAEIPHLKELYDTFYDDGLRIIGVSLDTDARALKDYVKEHNLPWPQFCDEQGIKSQVSSRWGIHGIPREFVVDQGGNLYSIKARGQEKKIIQELLNPQPKENETQP